MGRNYTKKIRYAFESNSLGGLFGIIANLANAYQTKTFVQNYVGVVRERMEKELGHNSMAESAKVQAAYGLTLVGALYELERNRKPYRSWSQHIAEVCA